MIQYFLSPPPLLWFSEPLHSVLSVVLPQGVGESFGDDTPCSVLVEAR